MENHIADVQKIYASPFVIATEDLLVHWQGHRRLTRSADESGIWGLSLFKKV